MTLQFSTMAVTFPYFTGIFVIKFVIPGKPCGRSVDWLKAVSSRIINNKTTLAY